ncbi:MAG: PVC-type heme-binding CxxCH protein [Prosthecobacter sp.]|nr:PVC-type heme-binding CxxCH protein [Prosthecobacter sp.]
MAPLAPTASAAEPSFRAGAVAIDITPKKLPAIIAGQFLENQSSKITDPLHARCIVLDDGMTKIALAIVDTCMMTQKLIDETKQLASARCGIREDHVMVSATHTHSAPAAMGCLGTRVDKDYAAWLPGKIAEGIVEAVKRLQPAKIGWASIDDWEHTHNRRWIRRPETKVVDPFGEATGLANMHPGYLSADIVGPSGPVDPGLSVLSVQTREGKPLAVLANYSQHYFGSVAVSADYYGLFCKHIAKMLGEPGDGNGPFVCAMSQGTSGDLMWMDYGAPKKSFTTDSYAEAVAKYAEQALKKIQYQDSAPLAMVEKKLKLNYRVPDEKRLEWARPIAARIENELAKNKQEIYANEALVLHERQRTEIKLQAIRIGELTIATLPNEVYALTGLKLKAQSPFAAHFNIELANGAEGYIPTPEQHVLGGYTTWPARTAGLEVQAEPKIVAELLNGLEEATGRKRRAMPEDHGPYAEAVLNAKPVAYWRLNEAVGKKGVNAVPAGVAADVSDGAGWYLPGAGSGSGTGASEKLTPSAFSGPQQINRALHLAGGKVQAELGELGDHYSIALWFWLGEASGASERAGTLVNGTGGESLGTRQDKEHHAQLVLGGVSSKAPMRADDWHFAVLVRDGKDVRVHVDGGEKAEIEQALPVQGKSMRLIFGEGLQGKLDEIAVFSRALTATEVSALWKVSGMGGGAKETTAMAAFSVPDPLRPEESLKKVHLPKGYQAEIVAAEPLLRDPVAFDWDERGRLWVVEMADYPLGMDGKGKSGGRVRVLEDTDGDGRYDKSQLFADGLNFPNGIMTWRDGVIVTAAPNVWFLKDTDDDGKADEQEVLISGLQEGNQQLRANGLRWGLDNWIYFAIGGHHGKYGANTRLKSLRSGQEILVGARDFRFRPDTGELEPQSGPTQFGRNRDNWGHWFGTQNAHPLWHYVLPEQYLRRNPHFGVDETRVQLLTPATSPPVYPASEEAKRYHDFGSIGHFTSACSGLIYRDQALFGADSLDAFVCEPVHNLVQHLVLKEDGVSFTANQKFGDGKFDFFANEDRWSRPVMVREGPDGALWIADMYRYMIEHPDWLPPAGKAELMPHFRLGEDKGRIYRVTRAGTPTFKPALFEKLSTSELVAALDTTNGWRRDKAHQVLLWRADKAALAPLQALAEKSANPLARLHALCVLDGLGGLQPAAVARALGDESPGVLENALRLAEARFTPEVLAAAVRLTNDKNAKVRLQLAFSLGAAKEAAAGEALGRLLTAHADDPMMVAAVMSSALPHVRALIAAVASQPPGPLTDTLLTIALGLEDRDAAVTLLAPIFATKGGRYSGEQIAGFARLLEQLAQRKTTLEQLRGAAAGDALGQMLDKAKELFAQARELAGDTKAADLDRISAAALLGRDPATRGEALPLLTAWLDPKYPTEAQAAAIRGLATLAAPAVPAAFAKAWPTLSPIARQMTLGVWMSREPWAFDLVQRLQRQELPVSIVDTTQRARLIKHDSKRISQLAAKVFAATVSARGKVVESYQPALSLKGDVERGHQLFSLICAVCHKRGTEGRDIGPDLLSVVEHPPEKLLGNILDPSADIQPGFNAYTCTLNTGEQLYGLLASENANSVVMKLADGTQKTVRRNQIQTLQSQNLSLMPEGLEGAINPQQMADLIAFLRSPVASVQH